MQHDRQTVPEGDRPCGPGRPVQMDHQARETMVLDAAVRVLTGRGIREATMAAIAREAGMSKRTLYALFGNRDALIAACVRRVRTSLIRPLTEAQSELPLPDRLRLLLTPEAKLIEDRVPIEILRAAISEARTQPEVARSLLVEGMVPVLAAIRAELSRAVERLEIELADLDTGTELLRDMVYGNPCDLLLDPLCSLPDMARFERRIDLAIRVFLNGLSV